MTRNPQALSRWLHWVSWLSLLVPLPVWAAEKTIPVLLSRAVESARQGDPAASRKHLKTFLNTRPAPGVERRVRLADLALVLQTPGADIDQALRICRSIEEEDASLGRSFEFLYCRGLIYQRLAARELAERSSGESDLRQLVKPGATWRYFKGTAAPPRGWREPVFDASGWLEGKAGFGYGDEDDATELTDMQGKYPSVFLRRGFFLPTKIVEKVEALRLRVRFDDGFIAFLNGSELTRVNLPGRRGEEVAHDLTASGQNEADKWEDYIVGAEALRGGLNTLTLQAHNYTLPSSDFSIEASLSAAARREGLALEANRLLASARRDLSVAAGLAGPGPLRARLNAELAVVRMLGGEFEEAARDLLVLERGAGNALKGRLVYLRSWIALREGRPLEAGRLLARFAPVSLERSGPGMLYLMGRIHHCLGERREAEAFYRLVANGAAGEGAEHAEAAKLALGAVLIELGEEGEAAKLLKAPAGNGSPTARELFARLLRGAALLEDGKLVLARNEFVIVSRAALDKELRSRALFWTGRANVLRWEKGDSWMRKRLSEAAIDSLDRGLFLGPGGALERRLAFELGEALLKFGRPAEAEAIWRKLEGKGGEDGIAAAWGLLVSLQGRGDHSRAAALARDILKLYPSSVYRGALLQRLGDSLLVDGLSLEDAELRRERFAAAGEAYEKALGSAGLSARLPVRFRRGVALLLLGNFQEARGILQKVAKAAAQTTDSQVRLRTCFAAGLLGRLYLLEGEQARGDAFSAALAVENFAKAEKYLEEFRLNTEAPSELRARAEFAQGLSLRLHAGLLADPAEQKKVLAEARGLLAITARRMEYKRFAVRAGLELARVEALRGRGAQAASRLEAFASRSPWKESEAAGEALLELARQQAALGKIPEALETMKIAGKRARPDPDLSFRVLLEEALLRARQGELGAATLALAALYHGPYGTRLRARAALELLRLESSEKAGDRARKLGREVGAMLSAPGSRLDAELRADLLLELVRLDAAPGVSGAAAGSRLERAAPSPTAPTPLMAKLRSMLPNDDRRVVMSLLYEAGMRLESGRAEEARALTGDAYSYSRDKVLENEALLAHGVCLLACEKTPEALRVFEGLNGLQAIAGNRSLRHRVALCLGVAHTRIGDPVKAKQSFQRARGGGRAEGDAFKSTLTTLQALAEEPDDSAPDATVLLARLLLFRPLHPADPAQRWPVGDRRAESMGGFLEEVRILGLAPLPYDAVVSREPADSRMWSKLTPLPLVPAPGAVPGAILGQVVRRALTGDRASEEGDP